MSPAHNGRLPQSPMGPRFRTERSLSSVVAPSPTISAGDSTASVSPIDLLSTDPLPPIAEMPASPPQPLQPVPKRVQNLSPPPTLNFSSVPVKWKGLPLEAALWTFNSQELQELVSRSIRLTAHESFIRLLSLENLDRILPAEAERLHSLKSSTQSKYRFLVHRRTMLLQALNSSADFANNNPTVNISDSNSNKDVVSELALQLSQTTEDSDRVLEEMLQIGDQLAQIEKMVNLHWTSALAVALRKLNKSYARRTSDLMAARGRIEQLEVELDDAWKEAERIAKEMDYFTMSEFDVEEAVIEMAEKVSVPNSPSLSRAGVRLQVDPLPHFSPLSLSQFPRTPSTSTEKDEQLRSDYPDPAQRQYEVQAIPSSPSQPQLQSPDLAPPPVSPKDTTDTASIRSNKSTRSTKSNNPTHLARISSARTRSYRASKSSLRLPNPHPRSQSRSHSRADDRGQEGEEEQPPVPDIPLEFSMGTVYPSSASPKPSSNIVWPGSSAHSQVSSIAYPQLHSRSRGHSRQISTSSGRVRRTSLDDIVTPRIPTWKERGRRDSDSSYTPTVTVDDIHVPPPNYHNHPHPQAQDEIQTVPRTLQHRPQPLCLSNSHRDSQSMRKRLSQSVEAALDLVTISPPRLFFPPLSPKSPKSLPPLPPSPLSPKSFDTEVTVRGREGEREVGRGGGRSGGRERSGGRDSRTHLFSGSTVSSMWLHRRRGADGSPPMRGRGQGHEYSDGVGGVDANARAHVRGDGGESAGAGAGAGRGPSMKPYERFKTLTKRYSLSFPLSVLVDRARPGTSASASSRARARAESGVGAVAGMSVSGSGGAGAGMSVSGGDRDKRWRPTSHVSSPV